MPELKKDLISEGQQELDHDSGMRSSVMWKQILNDHHVIMEE